MVTLRDVARAAGVSPATASRALAAPPGGVATERRQRVLRAADDLGYRPPGVDRGGAAHRTRRLGVIVPDMENPFFSGLVKGIQHRARTAGMTVVVADADEDSALESELVDHLAPDVDGLVLCSPRMSDDALAALAARAGGPAVLLVNRDAPGLRGITVDNVDGVRQALEHLHALGHRRIAYAGGPTDSWSDHERRRGLAAVVAARPDVELVDLGHFPAVFAGGVAAADLITASGATAVLAYNDLVALGVLDRLRLRGVRVPDAVSVVGFDDVPPATQVSPALTTVALPLRLLGRTAVDALLRPAAEVTDRPPRPAPVSLVVRGSTGPRPPAVRTPDES
ncbi:LacI family DNA-binding transcriptional regulator [uncultured Cellulomonas sp.]|uniref:LacI family DNA-binding transcriptional regulator n=1 Tax=uncultured Cellulomonas sp. TaxID=189682 RepID=UPI00262DF9FD|nr:LacI family DNA-binding transcriptional regulator [uncultured Cellulomonas sp.]